jgi:hypothetical protein
MTREIEKGDLVGVDGSGAFDHGCADYAVLRYLGNGKAQVIEAQSCHSCWQVGHDQEHIFAAVGDVWILDMAAITCVTGDDRMFATGVDFEYSGMLGRISPC